MQIKSILKKCCDHMDLDVPAECFSGNEELLQEQLAEGGTLNILLKGLNSVVREITSEYFPEVCTAAAETVTGEIPLDDLEDMGEILYATDGNGVRVRTFYRNGCVVLPHPGSYTLTYLHRPLTDLSFEDSYYSANFNLTEDILAYGALCEYCLYKEDYDNMAIWDKRYKDGLQSVSRPRRNLEMPRRRWLI